MKETLHLPECNYIAPKHRSELLQARVTTSVGAASLHNNNVEMCWVSFTKALKRPLIQTKRLKSQYAKFTCGCKLPPCPVY